mgnify:CR=1 FL=1
MPRKTKESSSARIPVRPSTLKRLKDSMSKGISYDEFINDLLDFRLGQGKYSKQITIAVDDTTYDWLEEKRQMMGFKDLSSVVTTILKSYATMVELGTEIPDEEMIDRFMQFLRDLKTKAKSNHQWQV